MRLTLIALLWLSSPTAWAQLPGPGAEGSVLRDPFAPPQPAKTAAPTGSYVENLINQPPAANPNRPVQPAEEKPDINRDIQVTREVGPWMIMVHAYTGPEAATMARQMVHELRTLYKLPAYTFNYGAEERRKEQERIRGVVDKQKEYLAKNGLTPDHIRIRTMRVEEQVGVLVGGYPTDEAANKDLVNRVRKLKPLDPDKVKLDKQFYFEEGKKKDSRGEMVYVNPFKRAFVAHNPTTKLERPADWDKLDMNFLTKINSGEPFSLLACKKNYTLAVKQFQTPTVVDSKSAPGSFLEKITLGGKSERVDAAATSAHNLAEILRKAKLDAYVLHTKYTSIVCVGGFDSLEDPGMRTMAQLIESKVMPQITQMFPPPPNQAAQAKVMPMKVPH